MTAVEVFLCRGDEDVLAGRAYFTQGRGGVSTTFIYDAEYLSSGLLNLDPSLQLTSGPQYQSGLLRAFEDTAPDRWGRNLLDKSERAEA